MSREIGPLVYDSGETLYVLLFNRDTIANYNKVRDRVANAWDTFVGADWADYTIALTEDGTSGNYFGDLPTGVTSEESLFWVAYIQAGGSPAKGDSDIAEAYMAAQIDQSSSSLSSSSSSSFSSSSSSSSESDSSISTSSVSSSSFSSVSSTSASASSQSVSESSSMSSSSSSARVDFPASAEFTVPTGG